jgi:hypothetical protein
MADGEVKINTKLDTSGVDKGVKDLKTKLNDAGKTIDEAGKKSKNLDTSLGSMNKTALATAGAVGGVAVAVKKTVDALNDCEAAYKIQRNAEIALQQAAKNNPYLNNESVYNLRNFASELQSMSNIGDEVSIKVMSQLAATGRTESQIMQIMKAAADMAAVTDEDIASAATKLNATLNGNAGMLGRQITSINNLTKEELEAGRAIEIVAQQYNGNAAAMADNTVQLANAWGDFKENIGRGWSKVTAPVKQFFLDVLNDINEATSKTRDLEDKDAANQKVFDKGAKNVSDENEAALYQQQVDVIEEKINKLKEAYNLEVRLGNMTEEQAQKEIKNDPEIKRYEAQLKRAKRNLQTAQDALAQINEEKKQAEAEATAAEKRTAQESRDKSAADYIQKNKAELAERVAAMELEAKLTGESVNAQDLYNVYMQSYIDLITKSNDLVTENNSAAKERLELLELWAEKARDAATEEERLAATQKAQEEAAALLAATDGMGYTSIYDKYIARDNELLKMKEDINNNEVLSEQQKADSILKIDEEMTKNRRELWAGVASEVGGYAQQVNEIINDTAALALETEKKRMQTELDNLEIQHRKGEIGEEEYQEKVAEAKKKGAEMQYKIEMAQWSSNILAATANTAVGVTQALAQGGVAGIVTGALVAAAGAVQLASIMAAKPVQHFASGGFVGGMNGASMGADNTTIAARSGEMVVNANQQRALWDMLNGSGETSGAGDVNVVINNSAANLVTAQPQITRGQIELMIDARVNDGLRNGRFDGGLNAANAGMSGEFYGV